MKRTVKALQDLYVKLGGQLTDTYAGIANGIKVGLYKRIPDIIEAVKEKASGGSGLPEVSATDNGDVLTVVEGAWAKADAPSGLPEVTAADNGDVLTVVEGQWAKADAPSGGGALIVGVEYDETASTYTLSKTWQEIYNAVSQGIGAVIVYETPVDRNERAITVTAAYHDTTGYAISVSTADQAYDYTTDQANGYPSMSD